MLLGLPEFDLVFPRTVAEACALLHTHGETGRIIAGGTDLLVKMKHKRVLPKYLINIKGIPGLDGISSAADGLRIGALTTIQAIKDSPLVAKSFPVLHQAASKLGTTQIRNLGTLGGNLANASPSGDCCVALLVLDASLKFAGPEGEGDIGIHQFFLGPGKTALAQNQLLTEVFVPNVPRGAIGLYLKHSLRAMDVAIASVALLVVMDGGVCRDVRIGLGAVAPVPMRAPKAEAMLRGKELVSGRAQNEFLGQVAAVAAEESLPITDVRAHAAYRRKIISMLVSKGLEQGIARAKARGGTRR